MSVATLADLERLTGRPRNTILRWMNAIGNVDAKMHSHRYEFGKTAVLHVAVVDAFRRKMKLKENGHSESISLRVNGGNLAWYRRIAILLKNNPGARYLILLRHRRCSLVCARSMREVIEIGAKCRGSFHLVDTKELRRKIREVSAK